VSLLAAWALRLKASEPMAATEALAADEARKSRRVAVT
jgi:hypothetical protein